MPLSSSSSSSTQHGISLIYLLLAATLWSVGGLLIKLVPWTPLALAGARSAIAATVIFLFLDWSRLKPTRVEIVIAIFYALTVTLLVSATKLTTAANAILLQYTAPIYVLLLSHYILKERAQRRDFITAAVVVCGMSLFFYEKLSFEGFWGNILAILSGVTFAIMTVLMRKSKNPLLSIFYGNVFTGIALSEFIWKAPSLDYYSLSYLVILGVFQLGLSYIFYSKAVPYVRAFETVLVAMLEPVLNPLWVFLFLAEAPSLLSMLGGFVIVLAVGIRSLKTTVSRIPDPLDKPLGPDRK